MHSPQSVVAAVFWVLGGLGLFVYGIELMGRCLRKAAGSSMRKGLDFLTRTRFHGLATGTVITGLLQSSSATTVMIVGFIGAGLMTFPQSIGLILGANIGTTVTPQITALNLDELAIPFVGIGFIINFAARRRILRQLGLALMGFGMLFFGLVLMKFAVAGYSENIRGWLEASAAGDFFGQFLAFSIAMVGTCIIQSSAATIVMLQALAEQGALRNVDIAIPMILGAHVGTCITAILASLKASKSAKKAAVTHLVINVIGTIVAMAAFNAYARVIPLTAKTVSHQIANGHLIIKIVNVLIFLPFTRQLAGLINLLVSGEDKLNASPQFLNQHDITTPHKAFDNVRLEIQRMCRTCIAITKDAVEAFFTDDEMSQELVLQREELVDDLYDATVEYVLDASGCAMPPELSSMPPELMLVMSDIERIGDHAENIVELSQAFRKKNVRLSDEAHADIRALLDIVEEMGSRAVKLFDRVDQQEVEAILALKVDMKQRFVEMIRRHEKRLHEGKCTTISGIVFTDMVTNLRRVSNHIRNVAIILGNHPEKPDPAEL